jgi:hypothetical protein
LLSAGRPHAAAKVLTTVAPLGLEADVLRGEALLEAGPAGGRPCCRPAPLQAGDPAGAREAVEAVPDAAGIAMLAAGDRITLRCCSAPGVRCRVSRPPPLVPTVWGLFGV